MNAATNVTVSTSINTFFVGFVQRPGIGSGDWTPSIVFVDSTTIKIMNNSESPASNGMQLMYAVFAS